MNHVIESGKEVFLVTITLEEYRDLVTKCARYDLLQEQEKQRQEEIKKFNSMLGVDCVKYGDAKKPVQEKNANAAISTEITEK